jgi:predicted RNA-binding Zn-ribbon protein involved in translation (DUF1610 family)
MVTSISRFYKPDQVFAGWWRFTQYEFDGYIRPTKNAILVKYNPWNDYNLAAQKRKGGGLKRPPYLSLVDFADANTPQEPEWERRRFAEYRKNANVVGWCNQHGLLGIFFTTVRQVALYPRWRLPDARLRELGYSIDERKMAQLFATYRMFVREPTGWTERNIIGSKNLAALTLAPAEKETGGLVAQEFWDEDWEPPGVLIQDPGSSIYARLSIADVFGDFFPSIHKEELETFPYSLPGSDEFWSLYAEPWPRFIGQARLFARVARTLGKVKPLQESTEEEKRSSAKAVAVLQSLVAQTTSTLSLQEDGTLAHHWVPTSLMASYAMMLLLDAARGLLNVCVNCDRVFVSSAGRAKFCSPQCRKSSLQRGWRARKAAEEGNALR